jgi:phage/plasmid primase-like uncharacterized protein
LEWIKKDMKENMRGKWSCWVVALVGDGMAVEVVADRRR